MSERFDTLETEGRNPNTALLDSLDTLQMLQCIHEENARVLVAVRENLPAIAHVVDTAANCIRSGGRVLYVGAGTSGRLGVLDASECPPTFGVDPHLIQGVIAGGTQALTSSIEGAEDSPEQGKADLEARNVTDRDLVIGIAASGRTPYVFGALRYAQQCGAATAAIVNVSNSKLSQVADTTIAAVTGPEPLTGSTRMKAGTAQKLVLNLISTGAMVRTGKVFGNLMVDVKASNVKLKDRAARIVMAGAGVDRDTAERTLGEAGDSAKLAITMLVSGRSAIAASQLLERAGGSVGEAVKLGKEDLQ